MCVRLMADYGNEVAPCLRFKHLHLTCPPRLTVLGKLAFQPYDKDTGEEQEGTESLGTLPATKCLCGNRKPEAVALIEAMPVPDQARGLFGHGFPGLVLGMS